MSTGPGPQQPQPARRAPEIEVLDPRDPPGRIAATRELSHADENWVIASREVLIFTHQVPESDDEKMRLLNKKSEHFQFYFWTALDRARRFNEPLDGSVRLWEYHDLVGMMLWWRECTQSHTTTAIGENDDGIWKDFLMSSPWFDCLMFYDLLWEVVMGCDGLPQTDSNGKVMVKTRNPKSAALEKEFFERWWLTASRLPLRRFENGDAVLPITARYYQAQHGTASMEWHMPPTDWVEKDDDIWDEGDEGDE
ncbi:hypothetical protein CDV31_013405 [Fusarium ambrosium]|uniref:Uncharacterized protein n=1 Tax=Fusarium ambrosium TaxID=131363 RepID=A0A428T3M7_9HYPO|nr:hypothetical protein CDV31_013405 [Fusarium ambrosium]